MEISILKYRDWNPEIIELINNMGKTMQSKIHHAEGDVLTHTQMVFNEVISNYSMFDDETKRILEYVAIFHDIAKPMTTVFEDGDWRSPGHAKLGEKVSREVLTNLDSNTKDIIGSLIRYHGLPIWFSEKRDPEMDLIKCSLRCNIEHLSHFAECDFRGRICNDLEESLYKIELFRESAQNLNCFNKPFEFTSDWARLHYFKKGGYPLKEIWEPQGGTFVLMVGLPGSGKNTWVSKNWDGNIIELDTIRKQMKIKPTDKSGQGIVANKAKEMMKEFLRRGENVLWNATNVTEQQRSSLIDIALQYDSKIEIVFMNTDLNDVIIQNRNRESKVPEDVIINLSRKMEIPRLHECHKLKVI